MNANWTLCFLVKTSENKVQKDRCWMATIFGLNLEFVKKKQKLWEFVWGMPLYVLNVSQKLCGERQKAFLFQMPNARFGLLNLQKKLHHLYQLYTNAFYSLYHLWYDIHKITLCIPIARADSLPYLAYLVNFLYVGWMICVYECRLDVKNYN